jgi:hypothetical protein
MSAHETIPTGNPCAYRRCDREAPVGEETCGRHVWDEALFNEGIADAKAGKPPRLSEGLYWEGYRDESRASTADHDAAAERDAYERGIAEGRRLEREECARVALDFSINEATRKRREWQPANPDEDPDAPENRYVCVQTEIANAIRARGQGGG